MHAAKRIFKIVVVEALPKEGLAGRAPPILLVVHFNKNEKWPYKTKKRTHNLFYMAIRRNTFESVLSI